MSEPRKHRLNPFKVLTLCLYGRQSFITREDNKVSIKKSPLCRVLRIPSFRLVDYLNWLAMFGYITDLELKYGTAEFKVAKPLVNWGEDGQTSEKRLGM